MKSFLDIAAPPASVMIRGDQVAVPGISAAGLAVLVARFEGIRKLVLGGEFAIEPQAIVESGPEAIAAFIAAGMGLPGDAKAEEIAFALPLTDQLEIIGKILEVTMPEGGPKKLQARVEDLLTRAGLRSTSSPEESLSSSSAVTPIRPAIPRAG
jgi:hypothetical protein